MEAVRDISQRAQQTGLVPAGRAIEESQALVPVADQGSPLPVFSGEQMAEAFRAYRQLQVTLDKAMPNEIMQIQGRQFRKKGYWRAVRTSFNLDVRMVHEERVVLDDGNWGWNVVYRATAPGGRSADGDGACYASEKTRKDGSPDPGRQTEHNVRSHAHTRAFNRAVSNLVGFGEVSAEEADREERPRPQPRSAGASSTTDAFISDNQRTRFWTIAKEQGWEKAEVKDWLLKIHGLDSSNKIRRSQYDTLCEALKAPQADALVDEADGYGPEVAQNAGEELL